MSALPRAPITRQLINCGSHNITGTATAIASSYGIAPAVSLAMTMAITTIGQSSDRLVLQVFTSSGIPHES